LNTNWTGKYLVISLFHDATSAAQVMWRRKNPFVTNVWLSNTVSHLEWRIQIVLVIS